MKYALFTAAILLCAAAPALADECKTPPQHHSKEFEKIKTLEGKWEGSTIENGKPSNVSVDYHLTSGGNAVIETLFPGTPQEMVSVYHDENGKLAMTHYCMLGNRPNLSLSKSTPEEIDLTFSRNNTIDPKKEDHMHSLRLVFIDKDNLVQNWSGYHNGKLGTPAVIKFSRVK
jgi:hypothetical protein